mgnify:CR=1 FL=1
MKLSIFLLASLLTALVIVPSVSAAAAINKIGEQNPISVENCDIKEYYPDVDSSHGTLSLKRKPPTTCSSS